MNFTYYKCHIIIFRYIKFFRKIACKWGSQSKPPTVRTSSYYFQLPVLQPKRPPDNCVPGSANFPSPRLSLGMACIDAHGYDIPLQPWPKHINFLHVRCASAHPATTAPNSSGKRTSLLYVPGYNSPQQPRQTHFTFLRVCNMFTGF